MLRKVSLVAALAISAASIPAFADPPRWRDDAYHDRYDHDRYDRHDRDDYDARSDEGPRFHRARIMQQRRGGELVAQYDQAFDTRDGYGPVVVDLGRGVPLHQLVIDSNGNSEVYNLVIQYADGTSQTFQWNHVFNAATSDGQAGRHLVTSADGRIARRVLINGYNSPGTRLSVLVR